MTTPALSGSARWWSELCVDHDCHGSAKADGPRLSAAAVCVQSRSPLAPKTMPSLRLMMTDDAISNVLAYLVSDQLQTG